MEIGWVRGTPASLAFVAKPGTHIVTDATQRSNMAREMSVEMCAIRLTIHPSQRFLWEREAPSELDAVHRATFLARGTLALPNGRLTSEHEVGAAGVGREREAPSEPNVTWTSMIYNEPAGPISGVIAPGE